MQKKSSFISRNGPTVGQNLADMVEHNSKTTLQEIYVRQSYDHFNHPSVIYNFHRRHFVERKILYKRHNKAWYFALMVCQQTINP